MPSFQYPKINSIPYGYVKICLYLAKRVQNLGVKVSFLTWVKVKVRESEGVVIHSQYIVTDNICERPPTDQCRHVCSCLFIEIFIDQSCRIKGTKAQCVFFERQ